MTARIRIGGIEDWMIKKCLSHGGMIAQNDPAGEEREQGSCIYFPKRTVHIYSGFIASVKCFLGPVISLIMYRSRFSFMN
jgi:hypothetical protein